MADVFNLVLMVSVLVFWGIVLLSLSFISVSERINLRRVLIFLVIVFTYQWHVNNVWAACQNGVVGIFLVLFFFMLLMKALCRHFDLWIVKKFGHLNWSLPFGESSFNTKIYSANGVFIFVNSDLDMFLPAFEPGDICEIFNNFVGAFGPDI